MSDTHELLSRFETTTTRLDIDGDSYELVHPRDADALIDETEFNRDERLPYWADIWPSSLALARTIRAMKGDGQTLLELGCGIGLVASVALRAGFDVTISDYYQDALEFALMNGKANSGREPTSLVLDWRNLPTHIPAFDYVVAADVLYERNYGAVVARTIATTLTVSGRAFIADPGRVGSHVFFDALRDLGLKHVGATAMMVPLHGREHSTIVHEITRTG